jgi:hypothetical protein
VDLHELARPREHSSRGAQAEPYASLRCRITRISTTAASSSTA